MGASPRRLDRQGGFADGRSVDTPRAVNDQVQGPRRRTGSRIPAPTWAFFALAMVIAAFWMVAPTFTWPPALWAVLRPLLLADGVATALLGATLFIRRPDVWSACRPLGVAVMLFAAGALVEAVSPLVALFGWAPNRLGVNAGNVIWIAYGFGVAAAALGILATAYLWMGIRHSRRRIGGRGSRRLAVALWVSTLFLAVGQLSAALRTIDAGSPVAVSVISFATEVALLVALTALTVTSISEARAGERHNRAWWLVAASGVIIILERWLEPVVGQIVREPVALFVLLPQGVRLVSTLLLLSAFALGFPSGQAEDQQQFESGPIDHAKAVDR